MPSTPTPLLAATDPAWTAVILDNFEAFLADHANCERKASALAMSMVMRYADRHKIVPRLIALAREELTHFEEVYQIMARRGIGLEPDGKDPYINQLLDCSRTGGDERLLDRLLICSLVEARGAERFQLLSDALEEAELKRFYLALYRCEDQHHQVFQQMAQSYFSTDQIRARLQTLAEREADIISHLEWRPSLH
ncbi:MAG: tRNA-(ms[2]io[6]A)-hydroxylase [Gammaproteobacteria bacterium]|nr:tRNA-(ms[2]io[6]A)-hydroxylase [Gammaproteobacteria bacterium]